MRSKKIFMSVMVMMILAACSTPTPVPVVPQEDIQQALDVILTQAGGIPDVDFSKELTDTPSQGLPSLVPSQTLLPSATPFPTYTPYPTYTPFVYPTATYTAVVTVKPKASITILGVQKNTAVTVEADNFLPEQVIKIRVGPYDTFSKDAVEVGTINSGQGGPIKFAALLPAVVKDVDKVTIRLDGSAGEVAYTYFTNATSGTVPTFTTTVTSSICQVTVSPTLGATLKPGDDFDAAWTVKNTSGKAWDVTAIDYKYMTGTEMQKYAKAYDLKETVPPGATVTLRVDMAAPTDPGTYTTNWALVQGSTILCNLPIKIVVK
jgi:hypothetical protein